MPSKHLSNGNGTHLNYKDNKLRAICKGSVLVSNRGSEISTSCRDNNPQPKCYRGSGMGEFLKVMN